jgi:hypothetical protein
VNNIFNGEVESAKFTAECLGQVENWWNDSRWNKNQIDAAAAGRMICIQLTTSSSTTSKLNQNA